VDSDQFVAFLRANLLPTQPGAVTEAELTAWLSAPGIPEVAPQIVSPRLQAVDAVREDWLKRRTAARELDTAKWTTQEWVYFLEGLPEQLAPERLVELDQAFRFTGTSNGEIAQRWYPLTVRSEYFEARPAMSLFLRKIGRRKLVMPTYEALVLTEDGRTYANQIFNVAKPGYHPITSASVMALLAKADAEAKAQAEAERSP
jgi:leukotriene-A4 hydrolase